LWLQFFRKTLESRDFVLHLCSCKFHAQEHTTTRSNNEKQHLLVLLQSKLAVIMPPSTGLTRLAEAASAATSRSASTCATGSSRLLEDDDSTDELLGIDHHGAPEVEEVAPPAPVAKHAVATATLKDVVLSHTATHLVAKAKAGEATYHSRIETIAGYAMADIDLALLRKFCSLN
jgi:hypothetical protein